jgi:hypothetical protein
MPKSQHFNGVASQKEHGWDKDLKRSRLKLWEKSISVMLLIHLSPFVQIIWRATYGKPGHLTF